MAVPLVAARLVAAPLVATRGARDKGSGQRQRAFIEFKT